MNKQHLTMAFALSLSFTSVTFTSSLAQAEAGWTDKGFLSEIQATTAGK